MKLIVLALFMGVAIFALVALLAPVQLSPGTPAGTPSSAPPGSSSTGGPAFLRYVCIAMVIGAIPMSLIARVVILGHADAVDHEGEPDPEVLLQHYYASSIVGCAMLEGSALFAVVIFLLSRDPIYLGLAAVPTAVMLAVFLPTDDRWDRLVRAVRDRHQRP